MINEKVKQHLSVKPQTHIHQDMKSIHKQSQPPTNKPDSDKMINIHRKSSLCEIEAKQSQQGKHFPLNKTN